MNIFLKTFVVLHIITYHIYADITKEELHDYLDVSQAGMIFLSSHHDTLIKLSKISSNKKALKNMVDNSKYLNTYISGFMHFNKGYYDEIMNFYSTDLGEKYVESIYTVPKSDELQKIYKQNICRNEKQAIIDKISNKLGLLEIKMDIAKQYIHLLYSNELEELKYSEYELEMFEHNHKVEFMNFEKMYSCVMYKDFTIKEMEGVLDFASSEAGKYETKLIYTSFDNYIKVFVKDVKSVLEEH